MSEQGRHTFLAAGLEDWVVLHGGATAVFRVDSLAAAAELALAVAGAPGFAGSGSLLTVRDGHLTVRLTRDVWHLEDQHVDLARSVSAIAEEHGAVADRGAVQEVQVAVSAKPEEVDVAFWRAVLGYDPASDDNAVDTLGHSSTVWLQELDRDRPLRHAMHLDVSVAREHLAIRLQAALRSGGRLVAGSPEEGSVILADQAGNKVCLAAWPDWSEQAPEESGP